MDRFLTVVLIAVGALAVGVLAYAIPRDIDRANRAEAIAESMGCNYIGSARDLNSVKFIDCNGEVKVIRVK